MILSFIFFLFKEYCIFVMMTTLTVNIENKKTEKAIKAILDAFGLDYNIDQHPDAAGRALTKSEQVIYDRLIKSAKEIKLYQEGKVKLQDASEFLNEL
jgi:hypothetical protein